MNVGRMLWKRMVPTRDGTRLAVDVALPPGDGPFPTLVCATAYNRQSFLVGPFARLLDDGYALVTADTRGRGDSEGSYVPWNPRDGEDAHDVIEWAAAQEWSAKVGMLGGSDEASRQWWTADSRPPSLVCMAPVAAGIATRGDAPFFSMGVPPLDLAWWLFFISGRTVQNCGAVNWDRVYDHLPLRDLADEAGLGGTAWDDFVAGDIDYGTTAHPSGITPERLRDFDLPIMVMTGWRDLHQPIETWEAVKESRGGRHARLMVGAWDHPGNGAPRPVLGGVDVAESVIDTIAHLRRFFDLHLKSVDDGFGSEPRVRIFRTGANRWEDHDDWPLAGPTTPLFLGAGGAGAGADGRRGTLAAEPGGDGAGAAAEWVYDPADPLRPAVNLKLMLAADPPMDMRPLERRPDVLTFETAPLTEAVHASGCAVADLWVTTDCPDTDVFVWLCDGRPDGQSVVLGQVNGWVRLRYRNGGKPELVEPGTPVQARIPIGYLHHTFGVGHIIRMAVTSSWFPLLARNLNTGGDWPDEATPRRATNAVLLQEPHASRLLLPVEGRTVA